MINKREVNKTDMLSTFPELFKDELVPGTWYYYTNGFGGIAYFKDWRESVCYMTGKETIGVNASNDIVVATGWFNKSKEDSRAAQHYRPATVTEVITTLRKALDKRGYNADRRVIYQGKTYSLTNNIVVVEDNIGIIARLEGSMTVFTTLPIVLKGVIRDHEITK